MAQYYYHSPHVQWKHGRYDSDSPPYKGLQVARQIAMISYRTHNAYATKFGRRLLGGVSPIISYVSYLIIYVSRQPPRKVWKEGQKGRRKCTCF